MKLDRIAVAAAFVMCSACAMVDGHRSGSVADGEITFQPANCVTKAIQGVKFTGDSFGTMAWSDAAVNAGVFMDNEKITLQDGVWKASAVYYWPRVATVDFESYYPYDATGSCPEILPGSIKYTDYTVDGTTDLLYSSKAVGFGSNVDEVTDDKEDGSVDSGYNGVPVLFHHALSKVSVNVTAPYLTDETGTYLWKVRISNPEFKNIYKKGSLSLSLPSGAGQGIVDWIIPESKIWEAADDTEDITLAVPEIKEAGVAYALVSDRYVLPQALDGQILRFKVMIETYKNGALFIKESKHCEVNLKTASVQAWEINSNVIYNISIAPTLASADGSSPVLVTVDPAVVSWDTVNDAVQPVVIDPEHPGIPDKPDDEGGEEEEEKPKVKLEPNQIFYTTIDSKPLEFSDEVIDVEYWFHNELEDYIDFPYESEEHVQRSFCDSRHIVSNVYDSENEGFILTLDAPVSEIGLDNAFCLQTTMRSVVLPAGDYSVGKAAFAYCQSLNSITLPSPQTRFEKFAFAGTGIKSAVVPDSMTVVPEGAFLMCTSVKSISIGKNVESIEDCAFFACVTCRQITFYSTALKSIGRYAFVGFMTMSGSVVIPPTVETIGQGAFYECNMITGVVIPDSVTSMGNGVFEDCYSLKDVKIGSGLTVIPSRTFSDCEDLRSITIPGNVKKIMKDVFYYSYGLSDVTISEGVEYIGSSAFNYCHDLRSITLPSTLKSLGNYAFQSDYINTFYFKSTVPPVRGDVEDEIYPYGYLDFFWPYYESYDEYLEYLESRRNEEFNIFSSWGSSITIYVPTESVEAYKAAPGWDKVASHIQGYDF